MEKLFNFVKEHPYITGGTAIAVLLIVFWPRGKAADTSSGTADSAVIADAVSRSQAASAQVTLSADQVRIAGLQTATALAINDSNNAAAMHIADVQGSVAAANAAIAGKKIDADANGAVLAQRTAALSTIAAVLPTTQANAAKAGQAMDAAGFSLTQMFANLLNFQRGHDATMVAVTQSGTIAGGSPAGTGDNWNNTGYPAKPAQTSVFTTFGTDGSVKQTNSVSASNSGSAGYTFNDVTGKYLDFGNNGIYRQ